MELPEAPEQEALLEPDLAATIVRGAGISDEAREPLRGRLMITGPVQGRIGPHDVDDAELKRFIEREGRRYWFHALRLACTFRPADDEPFTECWAGIMMRCASEAAEPPIAWSMEPIRLEQVTDISTKFTFTAGLKLGPANVDGGYERDAQRQHKQACVQAYGELGSEPWWELYKVDGAELRGMQQLKLVIRAPAGVAVDGEANVEAKVERRRFGIMKYRVVVPGDPPGIHFRLD
jgi:hypothetical protein